MPTPAIRIGFKSDGHLGYAAKCRVHAASGLNERVRDGYLALRATVTQMIDAEVDFVLDGGDLFHRSWPQVGDIVWARRQLDRFAAAGIPVIGNTGNHDASSERGKSPATASVHDPDRGIEMITEPYRVLHPADGVAVHMISHYGLAQAERLIPEPEDGAINLLSAHGAAMLPGHEVFRCVDSPGEQPIGLDLLADDRYAAKLLGHYHGMDEIMPTVWYAGSAIRRGFSDPAGGRGWLLITINTDGTVEVERKYIDQRPQYDLPVIDAAGLTGADVEERIRANLADIDPASAILRQVVTNCPTSVRRGIDQPALSNLLSSALMWSLDMRRPELPESDGMVDGVSASMTTAGTADLTAVYHGWVQGWANSHGLAEDITPTVVREGARHLRAASGDTEGTLTAVPAATPATQPAEATATEMEAELAS